MKRTELEHEKWRETVRALGFTDFISPEDGFQMCASEKWARSRSTGIYCWFTSNGEAYVGQAKNVRRRLQGHWKIHKDMLEAAFMELSACDLDEKESALIKTIGRCFPTRNIKHAIETATFVPFDDFMSEHERAKFVRGGRASSLLEWRSLPILEQKQSVKFRKFSAEPDYALVLRALKTFVANCLPNPADTENRFWSVTLYPPALYPGGPSLLRLNVGNQEVFTAFRNSRGDLAVRVLARESLDDSSSGPFFQTQCFDHKVEFENLEKWLSSDRVAACRYFVVWLMRHTTTLNNGSHCPQIIRACFASNFAGRDLPLPNSSRVN